MGVLKDSRYCKTVVLLTVFEIGSNLTYEAMNYTLSSVGYIYGFNMILNGIIELFAYIFISYSLTI